MAPPMTGGHIQLYFCAIQWLQSSIPTFVMLVALLPELFEMFIKKWADKQIEQYLVYN